MADGQAKEWICKRISRIKPNFRFFNVLVIGKWKIVQNENKKDAITNKMTLTMNQLPVTDSQ